MSLISKELSVRDILQMLGDEIPDIEYRGVEDVVIAGFSDPGSYEDKTAVWLGDRKYLALPEGEERRVALLFCRPDMGGCEAFPNVMFCRDPRNAFMRLVELVAPKSELSGVHSSAIVDPSAVLGEGVYIGPHAVIEEDVVVGDGTRVYAGCVLRARTTVGKRCVIGANAVLGNAGFGFRENEGLVRLPHLGSVILGDAVEVGSGSVIDRGTFKDTVIGSGTKLDSLTNVGHNVTIGENCMIIGGAIGGNSTVGNECELIHVYMKNRIRIGSGVRAGMGSVILQDIPEGSTCFGNPARVIKKRS